MARTDQTNRRKLAASEKRQDAVVSAYLTGTSLRQIAAEFGITVNTVVKDVGRAREEWRKKAGLSYEEHLPQKLAEIERMRKEAWNGWKRSLRNERRRSVTEYTNADGCGTSTTSTTARRDGDPRFLSLLEKYMRLECQLTGMLDGKPPERDNVPVFVEVVVNNRDEVDEFETITVEQFKQSARLPANE